MQNKKWGSHCTYLAKLKDNFHIHHYLHITFSFNTVHHIQYVQEDYFICTIIFVTSWWLPFHTKHSKMSGLWTLTLSKQHHQHEMQQHRCICVHIIQMWFRKSMIQVMKQNRILWPGNFKEMHDRRIDPKLFCLVMMLGFIPVNTGILKKGSITPQKLPCFPMKFHYIIL